MSYKGQVFQVPLSRGGFNGARNYDAVPSESFIEPSRNINLHQNGRGKRGGTQKVNSTAVVGVNKILGGYQFRLLNGTSFIMFMGDNGYLYKDFTTALTTGMTTTQRPSFETMDNELFIVDGKLTPQTWDGAAGATVSFAAASVPAALVLVAASVRVADAERAPSGRLDRSTTV